MCKLTFPPSRASVAGVSYDFPESSPFPPNTCAGLRSPAQPCEGPTHREMRPNPARPTIDFFTLHVVRIFAFWQTLDFGRGPKRIVAYNFCAGARWRESKLTESIATPSQGDLHHGLLPRASPLQDVTIGVLPRPAKTPTVNFCANASFLRSERSESCEWGC